MKILLLFLSNEFEREWEHFAFDFNTFCISMSKLKCPLIELKLRSNFLKFSTYKLYNQKSWQKDVRFFF